MYVNYHSSQIACFFAIRFPHRRVDLLVDTRGNDISVMNDSVLVGIVEQGEHYIPEPLST